MVPEAQLQILAHAKDANAPWFDIADALLSLEASSVRAPDGRTWISVASEVSKLSDNQLRRFTRGRAFISQVEEKHRTLAERLRSMPFAHIEVLGKIWQFDRARALEFIERPDANNFTYLGLLEKYRDLRAKGLVQASPVAAGKHAAHEFIVQCGNLLLEDQSLLGDHFYPDARRALFRPLVGFTYTNPDYIICDLSLKKTSPAEAVDCYFISGQARYDVLMRKMSQLAFESTFFTRFWCLIPPSELAAKFISACNELWLSNVGLVIVDTAKRSLSVIRRPDLRSAPVPDRTQLIISSYGYTRLRQVVAKR